MKENFSSTSQVSLLKEKKSLKERLQEIKDYILDYDDENPALYVGTYHKYNEGSIFGAWFDLTKFYDYDDFIEACRVLHGDEEDPELMFQDFMYFPEQWYSEGYFTEELFNKIIEFAELDENDREAYRTFLNCIDSKADIQDFRNAYCGEFASEEEYATCFMMQEYPEIYNGPWGMYFDFKAYAEDLFATDYTLEDGFVFRR